MRPRSHKASHRDEPKDLGGHHGKLRQQGQRGSAKFHTCRDYEILDEPWKREDGMLPVDIIAKEDDTIVFVSTKGRNAEKGSGFDDGTPDRDKLEAFAISRFTEHVNEYDNRPFRFDVISILVIGEDAHKALTTNLKPM